MKEQETNTQTLTKLTPTFGKGKLRLKVVPDQQRLIGSLFKSKPKFSVGQVDFAKKVTTSNYMKSTKAESMFSAIQQIVNKKAIAGGQAHKDVGVWH